MGWGGAVREWSWTVQGSQDPEADRAGLKGSGSPLGTTVVNPPTFGLHFLSSLQLPAQALTTHHPQTQTPAHGHGSGSLCRVSQPQHTSLVSGNRKPGGGKAKTQEQEVEIRSRPGLGFPLLGLFMTFPRDPPHTSLSSCRVQGVPTPLHSQEATELLPSHGKEADPSAPKAAPELGTKAMRSVYTTDLSCHHQLYEQGASCLRFCLSPDTSFT